MVSRDLKRWVDEMCDTIASLGEAIDLKDDAGALAMAELGMYMMYLSASDGQVSWQEAQVISEICNLNLTASDVGKFIQDHQIYSERFEATPPESFKLVVAADSALLDAGKIKRDQVYSSLMIAIYKAVGEALLKSDNSVTKNEAADYTIYTSMLERYQKQYL